METTELIRVVKKIVAKDFLDWRPLMKRIEDDPIDIDSPCEHEGCTLLQWGLENGVNQAASIAITLGASINAKGVGEFDCTPLDIASRKGNESYTDMLIRHGGVASSKVASKRMKLLEKSKASRARMAEDSTKESFGITKQHLESHFGVVAKADKATGFLRFRKLSLPSILGLTGTRNEQLKRVVTAFADFAAESRRQGFTLYCDAWIGASLRKCDLFLAPTDSDVELLTVLASVPKSPLNGNHGLLESLVDLHRQQQYQLLSINDDAILVSFSDGIADVDLLSSTVLELFPFISDYHTAGAGSPGVIDVHSIIADEIRDDGAVSIVYHSF